MNLQEKRCLENLLIWAIRKAFELNPDMDEICFADVQDCAATAWKELTGIEITLP